MFNLNDLVQTPINFSTGAKGIDTCTDRYWEFESNLRVSPSPRAMQRTWKRLAGVKDLRAMDLLAAAAVAGGLVHELSGDEDEALQVTEKCEVDDNEEDTEKVEGGGDNDRDSELSEVDEDDARDAYKPSPRKTRTRSEEVEAADAEGGNGKAPFRMPPAGTRVSMDY